MKIEQRTFTKAPGWQTVRNVYGDKTAITGFYSYREAAPSFNFAKCELHNQTMTITTFREA